MDIKHISSSERVFQLDRDTFLIYVGLHADDNTPFIRIGSGDVGPDAIMGLIKHVIIPEKDPINVGQEMEWVRANTQLGNDKFSYIGLDEHIRSIYKFAEHKFQKNTKSSFFKKVQPNVPIEIQPFGPPTLPTKDHVIVNKLEEGNFTILVERARVFDYKNIQKGQIHYDREYTMITDVLSRYPCRLARKDSRSFIWLGAQYSETPNLPSIYWNLKGSGVLLNPSLNYHQALFREKINPAKAKIFLSYNGQTPGFTEAIKNKHTRKEEMGLYLFNEDILNQYKHLYPNAHLHLMADGVNVPLSKEHSFYASKTHSHAAFSWLLKEGNDQISQIIFPFGETKSKRVFNVIRPPHDIEIQVVNHSRELKNTFAHLSLQIPGAISKFSFERLRLSDYRYPLVATREYIFHEGLDARELSQSVLIALHGCMGFDLFRKYLLSHFGQEMDAGKISQFLKELGTLKISLKDFIFRNNVYNLFRFIENLPNFQFYNKKQRLQFRILKLKYHPFQTTYKTWLSLEEAPVEFHIVLVGGNKVYLFTKHIAPQVLECELPPSIDFLEANPKYYPALLRSSSKALERYAGEDQKAYKSILDMMIKVYEDRLRILSERTRLFDFIMSLGLGNPVQSIVSNKKKVAKTSVSDIVQFTKDRLSGGGILKILAFTLILLFIVFGISQGLSFLHFGGISKWGDSSEEVFAASLVRPGSMQKEVYVPGEKDIDVPNHEVSQYVKELAKNNSFLIGKNGIKVKKLKPEQVESNLDLVFPGDVLSLPDLRQTNVTKGEHVWEIARVHYRKDFARMKIIQKQIYAFIDKDKTKGSDKEIKNEIKKRKKLLKRLAVTEMMRNFVKETEIEISVRLKNKKGLI